MKRRYSITLLVLTALLGTNILTGCGQEKDHSTSNTVSTEDQKLGGTVTAILADETLMKNYETVLSDFCTQNPDLDLKLELAQVTEIDQKINMAHAAGQDYDIINVNNSSVKQFYAAGVLEPLDEYLQKSGISLTENYSEALLDVGRVEGKQYAIPQSPDCRVLAYNKKLLDKAGIAAPTSQEDILAAAEKLAGDGVYAYARQMNSLSVVYNEGAFMIANGAAICKEENGKMVGTCNTPEMIASVQYWKDMKPYMPQDMNYNDDQVRSMFAQGKILFYIFGPWEINRVDSEISDNMVYGVDYDLISIPGTKQNASISGGFYVGIGADSKNKEAAWAVLEEVMIPENICKLGVTLPADQRCYDMAPYNEDIYQPFKEAFESAAPPMPYSENFNKICDLYYEYFNRAVIGGEDVEAMMEECDAEINKLFEE